MTYSYCSVLTGTSLFEAGGAGTIYVESRSATGELLKQSLIVDNNGNAYPRASDISTGERHHLLDGIYNDTSYAGGVTWLSQEELVYNIRDLTVSGNAHVAILSDSMKEVVEVNVGWLWGDRTGVLHAGMNQTVNIEDIDIYLPVNLAAYK